MGFGVRSPRFGLLVTMDDGTTHEFGPGDVMDIPPGHDAETVGDEACVALDFGEISDYARRG